MASIIPTANIVANITANIMASTMGPVVTSTAVKG